MRTPLPSGIYRIIAYVLLLIGFSGCQFMEDLTRHPAYRIMGYQATYQNINGNVSPDSALLTYLAPYRDTVASTMNTVIAQSTGEFTLGKPESTLGNLAADMLRRRASRELRTQVDIGVINNGGLRISLPGGEITIGHMYELMPFEDELVILKLTGSQVMKLADEIANLGGQAVSGLRMRIENGRAEDVLIGMSRVHRGEIYTVATTSFLADGGGEISALWKPIERQNMNLKVRELFIQYMRNKQMLEPQTDNRVRI